MKKYEVEIVFGHSFLNETGKSVCGDNKTRKVIFKGEADNEEMAVVSSNVQFGVKFTAGSGIAANTWSYKVSDDCSLVLRVK